ncbi:uncharacterized protein LOC141657120 [Silene latifolia]|uniref:uncharacterized protein LOC141657120 n=1 Tax=Silene latifolia TaxID=37657 RepID=UPI003D786FC1
MGSSNIRDLLTCFSPSLDFFAITSGDGRIKIWDTVKGQLQTEFSDIASSSGSNLFAKPEERGHLSIDYTCMKWVSCDANGKKKRKRATSLLVLGTGSGDVMALNVSGGQLKWKISDCHPGGVSAIASAIQGSCVYTAGADGMVCEIDSLNGNLLRKFKASTKAVSSICVSSDGKIIATAAAQMKIFGSADLKKIQKFTGHPDAVRCMTMSEDGKYVLSSAAGERYVSVWRGDGSKKKSASCNLTMEHPPVFLDCKHMDNGGADGMGFYVLAISEVGVCYFWYGADVEELSKAKPTKISLSLGENPMKIQKGASAAIFAARMQSVVEPGSIYVFLAQGFLIKPTFEKIVVNHGEDLRLNASRDGLLLPVSQPRKPKKQLELQTGATALDRSNAEGALLPAPKILDLDKVKQHQPLAPHYSQAVISDGQASPMEDQLRSLGILGHLDNSTAKSLKKSTLLKDIDLETIIPPKKMKAVVLSMPSSDAFKTLNVLLDLWQSRSCSGKYVLPWVYCILVHHGHQIMSEEPGNAAISYLYKIAKTKGSPTQSLLQLSGRLQLVIAQIDKATELKSHPENEMVESEDDDDSVDEVLFGDDDDDAQTSDEDNDQ